MTQNIYGVVILGSGIAGLSCALRLAEQNIPSVVLTKREAINTASSWAQGGVAAVVASEDSFESHLEDTCRASSQSTNRKMARKIIEKGPVVIDWLSHLGVPFTREKNGKLALGQEGGHAFRRIVHAEDATGSHIMKALCAAIEKDSRIKIISNVEAVNLQLVHENLKLVELDDTHGNRHQIQTSKLIIATGGFSGLYSRTTSPARGTGIALAESIGCNITNLEFVQFHPTALFGENTNLYLISEALRGEGAILRDLKGNAFMKDFHPDGELAPRDVVSRAIFQKMTEQKNPYVYLDATQVSEEQLENHFPNILRECLKRGINVKQKFIPITPAAHYTCGGIEVDENFKTNIEGIYAVGECSNSGLHGANRLASNSLLEGLVSALYVASDINQSPVESNYKMTSQPHLTQQKHKQFCYQLIKSCKQFLWDYVGIIRTDEGMQFAINEIQNYIQRVDDKIGMKDPGNDLLRTRLRLKVSLSLAQSALNQRVNLGTHYNSDIH